jgi:nucleoside-diphosphate-sugar epimerase
MRLDDGRIVPELCRQALEGKPLTLHGDGMQTRSFCYVDDLVDGIVRYFESQLKVPVNLGNPREFTIREFADALEKNVGKTLTRVFTEARPDDPRRRKPDISRAKKHLLWEPQVNLEDGLSATVASFRADLGQA